MASITSVTALPNIHPYLSLPALTPAALRSPDTLVLCYHAVSDGWDSPLAVTNESFDRQLSILRERGYTGVTFAQAVGQKPRGMRVAITFDDAYLSVYEQARPILESHGMPATVFVPTGFGSGERPLSWPGIDHWLQTSSCDELLPFGWQEGKELIARGWEIGSHTVTHPKLTQIDDEQLSEELEQSRAACERELEVSCLSIAYPYGDTDGRVAAAAAAAGYRFGAALPADSWQPRTEALLYPRVGVYRDDSEVVFRRKIARRMRRFRRSRLWPYAAGAWRAIRYRRG